MKNPKPRKVLILGSGALKIGEAGEFDYSGSQAIKALLDESIETVLVNPNIATIQTSDHLAEHVYFLPVKPYFVEKIIQKERPDAILLGFGGQTALNCGLALEERGTLQRCGVRVLGTSIQAIRETEDRGMFARRLAEIAVSVPRSAPASSVEQAKQIAREIGYPVMLRIAFALGGLGSGVCQTEEELSERAFKAFRYTEQILIEECLTGWKEVEYEVVRDQYDNCITICNMENMDPMGIHTGESIVVAPSQTLSNHEYHRLRQISIQIARQLGIIGECNVQFALDPLSGDYRVIELNARLSRSSALASKATGYPLAYVATKLALGYGLPEIPNAMTGVTSACFEPALDYVVVKMPRWDLKKFRMVSKKIGSGMKSVGEVMAIGRTFEEALQKALRMLEIGVNGLVGNPRRARVPDVVTELSQPTPERIFAIAQALEEGFSIDRIHQLSHIDKWFLYKIQHIVDIGRAVRDCGSLVKTPELLRQAKQAGFSDQQLAALSQLEEFQIRQARNRYKILPVVKQIDTLAAEYPARSNYLYLTYNGEEDDVYVDQGSNTVMVLGSGAYRIGSSVEFDWCCVNALLALRSLGYRTVMVNYNPETVSTDYNECDALYFEELNPETVIEIYQKEAPRGVIVSMGGQTPNNMVMALHQAGVQILGTAPTSIDMAENRHTFSQLLDRLHIQQPAWKELTSLPEAKAFAAQVGYPVLVRPSYVLSGATMGVASTDEELEKLVNRAAMISKEYPVVLSKFLENAKELELDGVACHGKLTLFAISEHVENAGVHSGDATLVFPAQRTYLETIRRIKKISMKIVDALKIHGPVNIQFLAKDNEVQVIECNVRASRSFPFVSKVAKVNFIDYATRIMMGEMFSPARNLMEEIDYVGVKAPQFSFTRLEGADPALGVEMASTGEVGCLGDDFEEAFLKALLSVGYDLPVQAFLLSTGPVTSKASFLECARLLQQMGKTLYATQGTAEFLHEHGIKTIPLAWPLDAQQPTVLDYLIQGKIDVVINIPKSFHEHELTNDYLIRRKAVDLAIPVITNIQLAERFVEALSRKGLEDLQIKSWQEYVSSYSRQQGCSNC
ncbi:MAG: carbamoyl-phosphate synthase (glutamine-hydrolyzing) large subunit [Nitrospirae bacterium]|nr:MAG: carbamoyl-phosphate synthase (glutamine-hydrolyzing) large subunit [Nitrospirota bacterium]